MSITSGTMNFKFMEIPYHEISHDGKGIRYASTGKSSVKRTRSLFQKEPITIAWLDSFDKGSVFYDIGANVGMYSIYAAVMREARVYAFEPESLNYAELNKNIVLNGLNGQVLAYCMAATDVDKADRLFLSDFGLGISYHDFEENSWTEDKTFAADWHLSKDNRMEQGCIGMRIDSFVGEGAQVPDHIKVDVDGLEHRVVNGMLETLKNPNLKTMLLEVNFDNPQNLALIDQICDLGWRFSWNQLACTRTAKFTEAQIKKFQNDGRGGLNYIFYKDEKYDKLFDDYFEAHDPTKDRILSMT